MRLSRVQRVLILAGSLVLQAACGGSTFAGSVGGTAAATSGGRTAAGSTGSGTGTASGGASGSGTGPAFMGPSCRTDADCNGGQTGTEIVCGAQGDCVVGCHSSTDCSPGDVCDSSVGDGICDNSEVVKISVGATARSFMAPASVQISGQGSDEIGKVQITSSVGTIDFQGASLSALTYEVQSLAGETLYQTLAVGSDSLAVFWIYCQAGEINYLYREDTSGVAVTYEEGTGTCSDDGKAVTMMVSLPAFVLSPPPGLVPDVVMQGAGIAYDGGGARFRRARREQMDLLPLQHGRLRHLWYPGLVRSPFAVMGCLGLASRLRHLLHD